MFICDPKFHAALLRQSSGRERKIFEKLKNCQANIYVDICMTLYVCVYVYVCIGDYKYVCMYDDTCVSPLDWGCLPDMVVAKCCKGSQKTGFDRVKFFYVFVYV